jgi:hypothetical protein
VDQDEKVIFKATPASSAPRVGPGAGSRAVIRSRAQCGSESGYQLMLITVWKSLSTPIGVAGVRLMAIPVSPAWVLARCRPIGSCVWPAPTAVVATACPHDAVWDQGRSRRPVDDEVLLEEERARGPG